MPRSAFSICCCRRTPRPSSNAESPRKSTQRGNRSLERTREKLRQQLRDGKLDERTVEVEVQERNFPAFEIIIQSGHRRNGYQYQRYPARIFSARRTKKRKMKVCRGH